MFIIQLLIKKKFFSTISNKFILLSFPISSKYGTLL